MAKMRSESGVPDSDRFPTNGLALAYRSGVGCSIYEEKIPIDPQTYERAREFNLDPTVCALNGGEDYELLFTINQKDYEKLREHLDISIIGHITDAASGVNLIDKSENVVTLTAQGWDGLLKKDNSNF